MKKLTGNLIEEDSSQCLKILSQYTVKKTKIDWQRFDMFCLRENEEFFRQIWQKTCMQPIILTSFFVIWSVFPKTNERKIEATPSQTQCPVKRLQRRIGELILTVLLVLTDYTKNMSVDPEDWDVDFAFPDFNLALFEWERSWCRNWIV